jgi:hypothetical protein
LAKIIRDRVRVSVLIAMLRKLTDEESRLIDRLLEEDFPGRDAILEQINSSRVREWDDHNGSLEFDIEPSPLAHTKSRIPVEGEFEDVDGITIHVLLHVVDGRVKDLEVYKDDSSPIVKMPGAEQLRLFRPEYPWPKP